MTRKPRHQRSDSRPLGRLIIRRKSKPGTSPGTLVVDPVAPSPVLQVVAFGADGMDTAESVSPAQVASWLGKRPVVWVDVVGLGDVAVLEELGKLAGIHNLALEDVVNVHQRPKVDDYGEHLFIVVRMPRHDGQFETEQVSLFIRDGLVMSFQEVAGDCLEAVRARIRRGTGRVRDRGADYLAYAILDAITDSYFPILERLGEELEDLEDETLVSPVPSTVAKLHGVKRELLHLRRAIWPMREVFHAMQREEIPVMTRESRVYLRDCYDHVAQLIDIIESYREIAGGLLDVYLSSVSNRMNEVMKVLTVVATIFIPLTFIAGVYGMNFDTSKSGWNMPELGWYFGYPLCLLLMLGIGVGMVLFFRRRGWVGGAEKRPGGPAE